MPMATACDLRIGLKGDKKLAELVGPSPVAGSPWHILCFLTERERPVLFRWGEFPFSIFPQEVPVAAVISLKGIDQAIANLNYQNETTLKYRLVHAIRGFYLKDESSVQTLQEIDAELLIKALWDLWDTGDDPEIIRNKRKNLSSTKSSVNADLKNLYRKGKNPEGISIGRSNIFVMSNEAKDKLLTSLSLDEAVTLKKIAESLSIIKEVLSSAEALADVKSSAGLLKLEELRSTLQELGEKLGSGGEEAGLFVQPSEDEEVEEVDEGDAEIVEEVLAEEEEEPEQLEEVEEVDEDEIEEVLEAVGLDDALEEAEEDLDEAEVEEDFEEVEADEALEEVGDGQQEMGLPVGSLGEEFSDGDDGTRKNKVLAEAFDGYLGTMERFYNQYLLIPQGEYIVGSKAPEKDERPERRVPLGPFYMGKFPVTNALFEIFVEKTGYKTTAEKLGYATVYNGRLRKKVDEKTGLVKYTFNAAIRCETVYGACWYQPFGPDSTLYNKKNYPVVQVSLEDAMAFAAWTGKRLPTENEWEAAARTEDGRVFPWGNEMKGNSCNIEESSVADTTVVNKYVEFENDFGIVDAIGNVLEWTLDTCEPPSHVKNTSPYRIVKGGSWISGNDIRLFGRFRCNAESPSNILGFRCVVF
jgi:formylglycine-generating enzyme required for sulfatase activity